MEMLMEFVKAFFFGLGFTTGWLLLHGIVRLLKGSAA